MPSYSVYVVRCAEDGREYVGRTQKPAIRWRQHQTFARTGGGFSLHKAIRELGIERFKFTVIACDLSLPEANERERQEILTRRSADPEFGFNSTTGGDDIDQVVAISVGRRLARKAADPEGERAKHLEIASRRRAGPIEIKRETMRRNHAAMGAEKMRDNARKMHAVMTPDQFRAKSLKANATLGFEGNSARCRKACQTMGPEGLSARAKKTVAAQTPEQRSEARRKSWAMRREREAIDPTYGKPKGPRKPRSRKSELS